MGKTRKKRVEVIFSLMSLLMKAGAKGIVANAMFAREHHWSPTGLHLALTALCKKGILICSSMGHDKKVSINSNIESHGDWLVSYYDAKVPRRYQKYLSKEKDEMLKVVHLSEPVLSSAPQSDGIVSEVKKIVEENERLNKLVSEVETTLGQEIADLKSENSMLKEKLRQIIEMAS